MKKQLLIALSLFSSIAQATTSVDAFDKAFSDTFKIRMGGYLVSRQDTVLSATTSSLVGTKINFQDDLGMQSKSNSFRLGSHYRFNDAHKIEFSYYSIKNSMDKKIQESLIFNGVTYSAGVEVTSHLDLDIYKLNYAYSFYHSEKVELALAAGLHIMGVKTGLSGSASKNGNLASYTKQSITFLAPLPVLGFRLDYALTPRFHINGAFDYFGISYEDFKGSFSDILVTAEYQLFDHWSAGLGLNITALNIEVQNDALYEIDQDITGFLAYVAYNY